MNKVAKIITAGATCAAAIGLCGYVLSLNREAEAPTFSKVEEPSVPATTEAPLLPENWSELYEYVPSPTGMSERAKLFLRQNKDIIGWISVDETKVDYPVVLCPGELTLEDGYGGEYWGNQYYLDHALDGSYARGGTLFMDYRNTFGASEEQQSDNILIYGHNMANNTMFGSLRKYRQDYEFFDESPFIDLSSNYKDYQYVIYGFMITSGNWYTDFRYWDIHDFAGEEDFNDYVDTVKNGSLVDTGVDVQYGDKLLTLSTCYASEDNSRFIVCARRLREHEIENDMSSIDRTEEYIRKMEEEEASREAEEASIAAEEQASREAAQASSEAEDGDNSENSDEEGADGSAEETTTAGNED